MIATVKVKVKSLSRVQLIATLWTVAYQAPRSMGFSRQEYCKRLRRMSLYVSEEWDDSSRLCLLHPVTAPALRVSGGSGLWLCSSSHFASQNKQ